MDITPSSKDILTLNLSEDGLVRLGINDTALYLSPHDAAAFAVAIKSLIPKQYSQAIKKRSQK